MGKPILCLDFDGVCHSYKSKWAGAAVIPDPPVDGLYDFLRDATHDFEINIFSTRSHQQGGEAAMREWFIKHCPMDSQIIAAVTKLKFPLTKPPAAVGIDDRVITFEGAWPDVEFLRNFKPWNKRETEEGSPLTFGFKVDLRANGDIHRVQLSKDGATMGFTLEQAKSLVSELSQRLA